jgi:hypothetical protein
MGRGRVWWGRVTGRLVSVRMRVSAVCVSMAHIVRAILGGLYRGAWWRLSLFRLGSLGNHPIRFFFKFASGDNAKIKLEARESGTHRSSSRRSASDSSGMVLLKIAPSSKSPLARLYRS